MPAFVTALFLNYLGLPQIIVGFVAVIIFAVFTKKTLDLENKIWATETIKLFCLLGIFGSVDAWSRNILIIGLIVYNLIKSEKKLNDKEKEKNKEKPSKKKKNLRKNKWGQGESNSRLMLFRVITTQSTDHTTRP